MDNRKKYLAKNTALFALNSIGTRLITFFLVPLYTSALITSEYGVADLVSTVATILVPIFTLNVGEAVMRFCLDEDADYNKIMSVGISVAMMSIICGIIVIPVAGMIPIISDLKFVISGYCIVQGLFQITSCYLRGTEQLSHYAFANIIQVLGTAVLNIIFLIVLKWGLLGYFYSYIMGYCIGIIYTLISGRVFNVIKHFHFDSQIAKAMIKYSIVLVPTSLMWWIMNSSDRIMVTAMVGTAANGIYAVSYKVPTVVSTMSTVFNQAWSYSAIKEDKSTDRNEFNNKMFSAFINFQLLITMSLLVIIKPFMHIYVSSNYYGAWKYVPFLLVGYFFMSLGTFLSTSYTVNKDSRGFLISGLSGAIVNIILNWLLIPTIGVYGAAFATCVSYIMVFTYRSFDTRKYLKLNILNSRFIIGTIILVAVSATLFVNNVYGYIFMIVEIMAMVILERNFILEICKTILGYLMRKEK